MGQRRTKNSFIFYQVLANLLFVLLLIGPSLICAEETQSSAQEFLENGAHDWEGSVINDPTLTRRCREVTEERNQKVTHKQKLNALLIRNQRLQKITPTNKITLKKKLEINEKRLKRELDLAVSRITTMEESIIRKGCPGITL